jgi:hypothetical protein
MKFHGNHTTFLVKMKQKIIKNLPLWIIFLSIFLAKNISVQETYGPAFKILFPSKWLFQKGPHALHYHANLNPYEQKTCTIFGIIKSSKNWYVKWNIYKIVRKPCKARTRLTHISQTNIMDKIYTRIFWSRIGTTLPYIKNLSHRSITSIQDP